LNWKEKSNLQKNSKQKQKSKELGSNLKKKNQDYGSNDEIENKLNFYKIAKNQNKKSKHWGSNLKCHKIRGQTLIFF
jgi:hypothetical protein